MIDHIGLVVSDLEKSKRFYQIALEPLGYVLMKEFDATVTGSTYVAGFGVWPKPNFWIHAGKAPASGLHVAFLAESRDAVVRFYAAAMAAGGKDNGPPGLRPHYHAHYYGAFVLDPDGHNIEAVCHADPQSGTSLPE